MTTSSTLVLSLVASTLIAGCAMPHRGSMAGSDHRSMDMSRMCEMHRQTMAGKSEAEQQAAAEAHVKAMHGSADPQMAARHREMMEAHCAGDGAKSRTQ